MTSRRERRQQARDKGPLHRLAMGWTMNPDRLTQRERRVLRRNGLPVEEPRERALRIFKRLQVMIDAGLIPTTVRTRKKTNEPT